MRSDLRFRPSFQDGDTQEWHASSELAGMEFLVCTAQHGWRLYRKITGAQSFVSADRLYPDRDRAIEGANDMVIDALVARGMP